MEPTLISCLNNFGAILGSISGHRNRPKTVIKVKLKIGPQKVDKGRGIVQAERCQAQWIVQAGRWQAQGIFQAERWQAQVIVPAERWQTGGSIRLNDGSPCGSAC